MTDPNDLHARLDAMVRELKELDAKATPGPWITVEEDEDGLEKSLMGPMGAEGFDQLTLNYTMHDANAELLCLLRNAVPDILAASQRLDEQEARVKELSKALELCMPHEVERLNVRDFDKPDFIYIGSDYERNKIARAALSATPLPPETEVK